MKTKFLLAFFIVVFASVLLKSVTSENFVALNENVEALTESESRPYYSSPVWTVSVWYHVQTDELNVKCTLGGKYECPMYDSTIPQT